MRQDHTELDESSAELLVGRIADEFIGRVRGGEQPDVDEYCDRHPGLADVLRDVLPPLEFLSDGEREREWDADDTEIDRAGRVRGRLGDFQLIREIGRGGMGVVYEARQISLDRRVALKMLPFAAVLDPRQLMRFKNEAQAAAHLHHTNIVPVFNVGVDRGLHFYAMQFIEGHTLGEVIAELGHTTEAKDEDGSVNTGASSINWSVSDAANVLSSGCGSRGDAFFQAVARLGIQAAEALEHAHQLGVIHRDIKPSNLMLDTRGHLWITDFGLASFQSSQVTLTVPGDVLGTLRYMSPEQALGNHPAVDQRVDVYSLGVTLYELLTLRPAFEGQDRQVLLRQIAEDEPTPPRQINSAIPHDLETILLKATAKEPVERYGSAQAMADDLRRFLEHRPVLARRSTLVQRAGKWVRRHRAVAASAVLVMLIAIVALATSVVLVSAEQRETAEALAKTDAALSQADADFQQAMEAIDEMLKVGERHLEGVPHAEAARRQILERALAFYERFLEQRSEEAAVRADVALAYGRVGVIRIYLAQHEEAEAALRRSVDLWEQLDGELNEVGLKERAEAYNRLGSVLHQLGQFDEAEEQWNSALEQFDNVEDRNHDAAFISERAGILNNLAMLRFSEDEYELAAAQFHAASESQRLALDAEPENPTYLQYLGNQLSNLGMARTRLLQFEGADVAYREAAKVRDRVVSLAPHVPRHRAILASTYNKIGELYGKASRFEDALAEYDKADSILTTVTTDFPSVAEFHHHHAMTLQGKAEVLAVADRADEAIAPARRAIACNAKALAASPGNLDYRRFAAVTSFRLGSSLRFTDELDEAAEHLERAVTIQRGLVEEFADQAEQRFQLGSALNQLAIVYQSKGDYDHAAELFREGITHDRWLLAQSTTDSYLDGLADNLMRLGDVERYLDQLDEADAHYREALALRKQLAEEQPTPYRRDYVSILQFNLAALLRDRGKDEEPTKLLQAAAATRDKLIEADQADFDVRHRQRGLYVFLGDLHLDHNRIEDSIQCYEKALKQSQYLAVWYGLNVDRRLEVMQIFNRLIRAHTVGGDLETANRYISRGRKLRDTTIERHPNHDGFRAEVAAFCLHQANIAADAGSRTEAEQLFQQAWDMQEALVSKQPHNESYREDLSRILTHMGAFQCVHGSVADGTPAFAKAIEIGDTFVSKYPNTTYYRNMLAKHCMAASWSVSMTDSRNGDADAALTWARRATELSPTDSDAQRTLGAALLRATKWQDAIHAAKKSILLRESEDAIDLFVLAMAHHGLGESEKARAYIERGVRWMKDQDKQDDDWEQFHDEAQELLNSTSPNAAAEAGTP